jgi:hypothetical protein
MNKAILYSLVAMVLSGCASSGRIGEMPAIPAGASSSRLVIIRASSIVGAAVSLYVALDGKDIFSIRNGDYTEFPISSGDHFISVKCFGGWSPTWKEDSRKFSAASEQASYFLISPTGSCAGIEQISTNQGALKVSTSTFVSPTTVSDKQ